MSTHGMRGLLAALALTAVSFDTGCNQPPQTTATPAPTPITPPVASGASVQGPSSTQSTAQAPPPVARATFTTGVTVHLERLFDGAKIVSFGLPLPRSVKVNPASLRIRVQGSTTNVEGVRAKPILFEYDGTGKEAAPRSLLVQMPASIMTGAALDVEVVWSGSGPGAPSPNVEPYAQAKHESPELVDLAERAIEKSKNPIAPYQLVAKKEYTKTLFTGWEPSVLATFPPSYLTDTPVFGGLMSRQDLVANPKLNGLVYLSDNLGPFADAALHKEGYAYKPEAIPDPATNFEGWLYDRCATFLLTHAHLGETRHLRHALRSCSYYGSKVDTSGPKMGIFTVKPDPDAKYSHLRGLYAYYALTGDEAAKAAGKAIADMWLDDRIFATPYRKGSARGQDKLWTERLLAVDLEAMIYGFMLLGDARYLSAFRELFETSYKHITTKNQAELDAITKVHFPPQNCFIHSASQHSEGDDKDPWCSGWMAELLVDPLLRYQEMTGDARVDEIFVRLARALRDVGTNYFEGEWKGDSFLEPKGCYQPNADFDDARMLVPLYGFGIGSDGKRKAFGESADFEHCADATALTAAAIRALKRQKLFDGPGVGPFKTEGESFVAMHQELSYCAKKTFGHFVRPNRDPRKWKSDALAEGFLGGDPGAQSKWMDKMALGSPVHVSNPARRLSWWFNGSLAQYRLLEEAGVDMATVRAGFIPCKGAKGKLP